MRISDWSSDVFSSDLLQLPGASGGQPGTARRGAAVRPVHRVHAGRRALTSRLRLLRHGFTQQGLCTNSKGRPPMRYLLAILLLILSGVAAAREVPIKDFFKDAELDRKSTRLNSSH